MMTSRSSASGGNNSNQIEAELKRSLSGEVKFDPISRQIYSIDASIFAVSPLAVIIPKTVQDIISAVKIANQYSVPIIARGAGTGITGGCIGTGIVIDTGKYLNRILEINIDEEYAICEPGVVQDQLNEALAPLGYRLGPDTSTGDRATIGGMLANNSAGARSLRFGKMVDHILEADLVLSSGELLAFGCNNTHQLQMKMAQKDSEGAIYEKMTTLRNLYKDEIETLFPKIPRRVSGYNLDELIKESGLNLSKIICGSEGTLGVITRIKVQIAKRPKWTGLCLLFFNDIIDGMEHVESILEHDPIAVEMIDHHIIEMGIKAPSMQGKLAWLEESPKALFAVELEGETREQLDEKLRSFRSIMERCRVGYRQRIMTDPKEMQNIWALRKSGLGLLLSKRTYSRAIAFLEDVSVAPKQLPSFMTTFRSFLQRHGKEAGIYGHVGSGCIHIRPYMDLRKAEEVALMQTMMVEATDILRDYGGALSGEHGDGYLRSWLNEKLFGKKLYGAFLEIKNAFDPINLMNPGKIVNGPEVTENLKTSPKTQQRKIDTFLDFSREGGFELSVDMCNGNGACKKKNLLMCPSFQATGDEYDTTRARAQTLRGIVDGKLNLEEFTGENLYNILDLCLECKGCKKECPSQVDMAKMKSEFLYQYHKKHGHPLRNYFFANVGTINAFASPFASLFNKLMKRSFTKKILQSLGITPYRPLPSFASERFSQWITSHKPTEGKKQVVLFNDTYMEFYAPHLGKAALQVLEALGYSLIVPEQRCCGRPLISKGMLPKAQQKALSLLKTLQPFAQKELDIIILEPSCLSAIKDDYYGLINKIDDEARNMYQVVSAKCLSLEEFLAKHIQSGVLPLKFKEEIAKDILFHGHCHQKALSGTESMRIVLESIPGAHVIEIPSGCCGVAGSFGYEKEHYDISMKIGNLKLLPFISNHPGNPEIVANGFSCRSQILHGIDKTALQIAEILAKLLRT